MRFLKYGVSTGACAAAASKAAVVTLLHGSVERVVIPTPIGIRFEIPVRDSKKLADDTAVATVIKNAGDDIDVTNGIEISATVKLTDDGKITIHRGVGVGVVTKPGLQVSVGESAINPVPRKMIIDAVAEVLPKGKGAEVTITVPEGEKVAEKTQNNKLGIVGGISILGTTGVVKPLSMEACRRSLVPQLDVALARGYTRVFFVPGNIGERITKQLFNVADDQIVQTGDFVGYMLDKAVERGFKEVVLVGHSGKLVKLAAGIFNTHHKMGDARNEVIAAYAGAAGASTQTIRQLLQANTTEESTEILQKVGLQQATYDIIAQRVNARLAERSKNRIRFSVVIVSMDGKILGQDENARSLKIWAT
ncbi:MAG: cobalt-precorrin-5B (C(1))-methyltransferase CbiD [Candidatus Bathyarchaeia archaeon]